MKTVSGIRAHAFLFCLCVGAAADDSVSLRADPIPLTGNSILPLEIERTAKYADSSFPRPHQPDHAADKSESSEDTVSAAESKETGKSTPQPHSRVDSPLDSGIVLEGTLLDKETGIAPSDDSLLVLLGEKMVRPNADGSFHIRVTFAPHLVLAVRSAMYKPFIKTIPLHIGQRHYFVACALEKGKGRRSSSASQAIDTTGPPWTVSGYLLDGETEAGLESGDVALLFDKDTVDVRKDGFFEVRTRVSGAHSLRAMASGYREAYKVIHLSMDDKNPAWQIALARMGNERKRRQMTVSAKRQPVHVTSTVSKMRISRTELERFAATMGDPVRALQSLPGISSENDVSCRSVVRGGDLLENRIFLDGIPLLAPYHFGGVRSTFNQAGIAKLTNYKSGFPALYPNALSSLLAITTRRPPEDSVDFSANVSPLQYDAYVGLPLFGPTVGVNASVQGSYFDYAAKKGLNWAGSATEIQSDLGLEEFKALVNLPDYQDFSAGIAVRPSRRFELFVNGLYNTDRFRYAVADSLWPATFYYHKWVQSIGDSVVLLDALTGDTAVDNHLRDTVIVHTRTLSGYDPDQDYSAWGLMPGPDRWVVGRSKYAVDTLVHYASNYSVVYGIARAVPSDNHILTLGLGRQRRWWDMFFPPDRFSFSVDTSRYDVFIDQDNGGVTWLYSGFSKHLLKTGIQVERIRAHADVNTGRTLHEIITKGSTNFGDFWGPITNDQGVAIIEDNRSEWEYYPVGGVQHRLRVEFEGDHSYANAGVFVEDQWSVTPRLTLEPGIRLEVTLADTQWAVSPRLTSKFALTESHELIASGGHYTQNNCDVARLALSENPLPEKAVHGGIGLESRLLPWLNQKIDIYGKHYYDLSVEIIETQHGALDGDLGHLRFLLFEDHTPGFVDSLYRASPAEYRSLIASYLLSSASYWTRYRNSGKGSAYGGEYLLRFDPTDAWHGWFSFTFGRSFRQRQENGPWVPFLYDRPAMASLVNYYRLPHRYELSTRYQFVMGIPYTSTEFDETSVRIGAFNDRRYAPYQRLDMKIAKSFALYGSNCRFFLEFWNLLNSPNVFLADSESREIKAMGLNVPFAAIFLGLTIQR